MDKKPPDLVQNNDSFKAIKMSLNQFCNNENLKVRINEFVLNANKIMFEAYSLANIHIIRLINENKQIPKLNQSFFQHCCHFVSDMYERKNNKPDNNELNISYNLYSSCRPEKYKSSYRDYNSTLINYIAKDMFISTTNHLVLNFYCKIKKFFKVKYNLDNSQIYLLLKGIYDKEYTGNNIIIQKYRDKLNNLPPTDIHIKKDPSYIIYIYNEILSYFNTYNLIKNNKSIRVFSLLPNKNSFTISNITIDKTVLKDIILSFKNQDNLEDEIINNICVKKSKILLNELENEPKKYWKEFFNIKNLKDFSCIIKTDGNSVSILYDKEREIKVKKNNKKEKDISNINIDDFDDIKAYDPGFRFICVGTSSYEKKENDIIQCSSKDYYHNCKINKSNKQKKIIYKRNTFITEYFKSMPSNKTNNITLYLEYISYVLIDLTKCLKFHFDKPFRKLRFTSYIFKQKTMNELCKKITGKKQINDNKKVLIGFGDWSTQKDSIIKGHRRGPVVELKNRLKKWCKLVEVDEFRTSKLCCRCHSEMEKMSYNNIKINSVLRCKNNECRIVIDRDINGCKNIFNIFTKCLKGEEKPNEFCRGEILSNEKKIRATVKVGITSKKSKCLF